MKQIKCLVKDIRDEMEGAEHYAKLAVHTKTTDRTLADTYAKMSEAELDTLTCCTRRLFVL